MDEQINIRIKAAFAGEKVQDMVMTDGHSWRNPKIGVFTG